MPSVINNTNTYIISPKRAFKDKVDKNWQVNLAKVEGLRVVGQTSRRLTVEADRESIEVAKRNLSNHFYIEPIIEHRLNSRLVNCFG